MNACVEDDSTSERHSDKNAPPVPLGSCRETKWASFAGVSRSTFTRVVKDDIVLIFILESVNQNLGQRKLMCLYRPTKKKASNSTKQQWGGRS